MIELIEIDGYKCLKDASLSVGKLNVLVGPNASGKSSVLQTLLLLRQSSYKEGFVKDLHLSGPLYEAGTAQDALHPGAEHQIKIHLQGDEKNINFLFRVDRDDISASEKRLLKADSSNQIPQALHDRSNGFAYLNAERIGPRVTYALPPDETHLSGLVGKYGEFTAAVLARAAANEMAIDHWDGDFLSKLASGPAKLDGVDFKENLANTQGRLDSVCNEILGWILPGAMFDAKEFPQSDAAAIRFIRDPLNTKASVRSTHIGFGLIYTLPIIAAALGLRRDGLLLLENPEAHLHPYSQSRIGVFLAMVASSGRQIFIETHSDHVINGIRLAARHNLISSDDVRISFFSRPIGTDNSKITAIQTSQGGRLSPWPAGFFDQLENDLAKLH